MDINEKKRDVDVACEILENQQEPMYYLDLIQEIGKKTGKEYDAETINMVYTTLNLDNRLEYQGEGYWFLTNYRGVASAKKEK